MADEKTTTTPPRRLRHAANLPRSDAGIEKLPIPDLERVEYGDGSGLRLRVNPAGKSGRGGAKTWCWLVVLDGKRVNATLGTWSKDGVGGGLSLSKARQRLDELKKAHQLGHLREELAKLGTGRAAAPAPAEGELLVKDLADKWRAAIAVRRKQPEEVDRTLDKDILPALGDRPVREVKAPEIAALIESVVSGTSGGRDGKGAPTQAGRVFAHVKQLFRYACGKGIITTNPADALDPDSLGVVSRICERHLTTKEIAAFWQAIDQGGATPQVRIALRLLLLLGVRSGELLRATWSELDLEAATWTIPVAHQKLTKRQETKARPWVVPLPPAAVELLKELEAIAKSLMPTSAKEKGLGPRAVVASVAAEGGALSEKALNHAMRRLFEAPKGKTPLLKFDGERPTPHDLRRTVRTHLGDTLGVEFHIAERCLNHSLGRIAATYDRGDYLKQRRDALELWSAYVDRLVTGKEAKVVPLAEARAR
jgi:integrase